MRTTGRLVLRVLVGALFVGHGTQKLFGWFGGGGPERTGEMFESAELRPGRRNALAAGTAEATGGALLATGLATPAAASLLSGVMLTAIRTVHWEKGVWNTNGGYEYPAVMLGTLFALTEAGPGKASVDSAIGRERRGLGWAVAQLAVAAVASDLTIRAGRRRAAADDVARPGLRRVSEEMRDEQLRRAA
jgi:putative oxidoreductase